VTGGKKETALMVRADNTSLRNKTSQVTAIQRSEAGAARPDTKEVLRRK
jgi:hypothetical protein